MGEFVDKIGDEHEAYVEARFGFVRVAGGTVEEIDSFFERLKNEGVRFETRKVLRNGTVIETIDANEPCDE